MQNQSSVISIKNVLHSIEPKRSRDVVYIKIRIGSRRIRLKDKQHNHIYINMVDECPPAGAAVPDCARGRCKRAAMRRVRPRIVLPSGGTHLRETQSSSSAADWSTSAAAAAGSSFFDHSNRHDVARKASAHGRPRRTVRRQPTTTMTTAAATAATATATTARGASHAGRPDDTARSGRVAR